MSEYPETFVKSIECQTGDAATFVSDMYVRPDNAPHHVLMLYHNRRAHFENGRAHFSKGNYKKYSIGYAIEEVHVDEHDVPSFDFYVLNGPANRGDVEAEARWNWCVQNCKGNWRAQAYEQEVRGTSCMLLKVWFDDDTDEAAFLAAFPGAAA